MSKPRRSRALAPFILALLILALGLDGVLALRGPQPRSLRARLADAAEGEGRRVLVITDAKVDGELGARLDEALARDTEAEFEHLRLPGLLPVDLLHLWAELDRVDPDAQLEVVVALTPRMFDAEFADQRACTLASVCSLRAPNPWGEERSRAELAAELMVGASAAGLDWLGDHTPLWRQISWGAEDATSETALGDAAFGLAASPAQAQALEAVLGRIDARRRASYFVFVPGESAPDREARGAWAAELAQRVHQHSRAAKLLDLDHPVVASGGVDLLALNLLHELSVPLRELPREEQLVHPEGYDRTLLHRVAVGWSEGGAWSARVRRPEGIAVDRKGTQVVLADTGNASLRQLRGSQQIWETLVGHPERRGIVDGSLVEAQLEAPRWPQWVGEGLYFIDGSRGEHLRRVADSEVETLELGGEPCARYRRIHADLDGRGLWALCDEARVVLVELDRAEARTMWRRPPLESGGVGFASPAAEVVALTSSRGDLYVADASGKIWRARIRVSGDEPRLGHWLNLFPNRGQDPLPNGNGISYPFHFDDVKLTRVSDLVYIERYDGLLVADELAPTQGSATLRQSWSERTQLRFLDLEARRVLPWLKALPHAEANQLQNDSVGQIASYWHRGSMAVAQDSASLFWAERDRSRVLQIADGLHEIAKSGNHHTDNVTVPILMPVGARVALKVAKEFRPDRFLGRRLDPYERRGPYTGVLIGSSLSSMSDRYTNYSFGRRLELELQRALGSQYGVRFDLSQVSKGAASFRRNVEGLENVLENSVPPDVVFIEAHDFANAYLKDIETSAEVNAVFAKLQDLKARYDSLVIFYDISFAEGSRRESMRSTNKDTLKVLRKAKSLGYPVLEPGDWLLARLLLHSPWGNQPFADNQHHPSTWAIGEMSQTFAFMAVPYLVEHFEGREPARLRERPAASFHKGPKKPTLREGLAGLPKRKRSPLRLRDGYVQTRYADGVLTVFVDLGGFDDTNEAALDGIARAVVEHVLGEDVFADVARELHLELVEFSNYDEYGVGVVDSANSRWKRDFDHKSLRTFLDAGR